MRNIKQNLFFAFVYNALGVPCLLYTSDAADERSSVDLGGRRIIKKKKCVAMGRHSMLINEHILIIYIA